MTRTTTVRGRTGLWAKRTLDVVVSLLCVVVLLPLFATIAICIKLDSRGSVLFSGVRVGRYGKPFRLIKFRTMVAAAQSVSEVVSTPNDDPRITRVGRVLRRLNLDELPSLVNVLKGEMSLVGPRPEVLQYVTMLTQHQKTAILSVRPGLTDWATVWIGDKGVVLAGSDDPERDYMEKIRPMKVELQLRYVRDRSMWVDIQLIIRTAVLCLERLLPGRRA